MCDRIRRFLLAACLFAVPLLLPPVAAATPSYVAYVGCSGSADAAPAHTCSLGDRLGSFFETTDHTEVQFQTCFAFAEPSSLTPPVCTIEQQASALTPLVYRFTTTGPGTLRVFWRVAGVEVASWQLETTPRPTQLTPASARTALREAVRAHSPGSRFEAGSPICPRVSERDDTRRILCFAEFTTGRLHNLVAYAVGGSGDRLHLNFRSQARWFRRWVNCPLSILPGTLTANNNCGYNQIDNDEDLLLGQVRPSSSLSRHPLAPLRWTFAEAVGFAGFGTYRARKDGGSDVYTNAVGDSFRYRP